MGGGSKLDSTAQTRTRTRARNRTPARTRVRNSKVKAPRSSGNATRVGGGDLGNVFGE